MHRASRCARRWWSSGLIAAWLFVQLATAAYACPLLARPGGASAAMSADLPCAEMMAQGLMDDGAQPGLCAEHCKAGTQSAEPGQAPQLPAPALVALFSVSAPPVQHTNRSAWTALQRDRPPPLALSVLHCCYRI